MSITDYSSIMVLLVKRELKKNPRKQLLTIKAKDAYHKMERDIENIENVERWAELSGVSRTWLYHAMNRTYGKNPKQLLRDKRYEKILEVIENNPEAGGYYVATCAGLLDEKALYKFLSNYYNTTFTKLCLDFLKAKEKDRKKMNK